MAKVLGRSKSMRLRSSPRDLHDSPSIPNVDSFRNVQDGKQTFMASRADSVTRPRTASGGSKDKSAHPKHVPIVINRADGFDFTQPSPAYYGPDSQDEGVIGMALGSPTQSATPEVFSPQIPEAGSPAIGTTPIKSQGLNTTIVNSQVTEIQQPQPKPKISRWKSIFGRKQPEPAPQQPFYLAQPLPSQRQQLGSEVDVHRAFKSPSPAPSSMFSDGDEEKNRQRLTKKQLLDPASKRITTASQASSQTVPLMLDTSSPRTTIVKPRSRDGPNPPSREYTRQVPKLTVSNESGSFSPTSPPLLDIDIPKIEMERYSVMFSSLLGPAPSSNNRNSSLLARRQANPERVKPLEKAALNSNPVIRPQRRATSPTVKKSPLSLFPHSHSPTDSRPSLERAGTLNRPRPLQRSRTLPSGQSHSASPSPRTASPTRKSFDRSDDGYSEPPSTAGLSTGFSTAPLTDDSDFHQAIPDYEADREAMALHNLRKHNAWKPDLDEPSWEIINKPTDNGARKSPASRGKTTTMRIVEATPSAQVGIARTVSVSRPTRTANLLKPNLGSPERLVDRKPLTPTLVELKNRKSQRVQIVDA